MLQLSLSSFRNAISITLETLGLNSPIDAADVATTDFF